MEQDLSFLDKSTALLLEAKVKILLPIKFKIKLSQGDTEVFIESLKKNTKTFLNRSIIFYGLFGSKKSFLMKDLMYIMKNVCPLTVAFAYTNFEKHDYDKLIPKQLVFEKFTLNDIKNIYNCQRTITKLYNRVNDPNIIKMLYVKIRKAETDALIYNINNSYVKAKNKLILKKSSHADIEVLKKEKDSKILLECKNAICRNIHKLNDLSSEEDHTVKYINLNLHMLTTFDNSTDELLAILRESKRHKSKQGDESEEILRSFFFKGRWCSISHWYAIHDEIALDPSIQRNAFYSIFTDSVSVNVYFNRSGSRFSLDEKKIANAAVSAIFKYKNYRKLVYCQMERKFYFVIGEYHNDFKMCSP